MAGLSLGDDKIGIAGKVEFISKKRGDILVKITDEAILYSVSGGDKVHLMLNGKKIHFSISEKMGNYFRCSLLLPQKSLPPGVREGLSVYNSVLINSSRKYYDFRNTLNSLAEIYEKFIYRVGITEDPLQMAGEIDKFSDKLESIIPVIDRLYVKYPELIKRGRPPAELRDLYSRLKILESSLRDTFYKIGNYRRNSSVKKSSARLEKLIRKLSKKK